MQDERKELRYLVTMMEAAVDIDRLSAIASDRGLNPQRIVMATEHDATRG